MWDTVVLFEMKKLMPTYEILRCAFEFTVLKNVGEGLLGIISQFEFEFESNREFE